MAIQNPNSCGQGRDPFYISHPLAQIVVDYGYSYSHSTPITASDGTKYTHHTFKLDGHNVGLDDNRINTWETSTSTASGRHWRGKGLDELRAHLRSKDRRYNLRNRK